MVNPKFYFQHDNYSRDDEKLVEVRMKHQMAGIGVYWCLVEMLHESNGYIETKPKLLAFQLQVDEQVINDVVEICFSVEDGKITCNRVKQNLNEREEKFKKKQETGRNNVIKGRWNKDTTTIPTHTTTIPNDSKVIPNHTIVIEKEKDKVKEKDIVKNRLIEIFKYEIKDKLLTEEQVLSINIEKLKRDLNLFFNETYPTWEQDLNKSDANRFCVNLEKNFKFDNFRIATIKAYKFLNK